MKTSRQVPNDKRLFDNFDNADEVLKHFLLIVVNERRRPNLDQIIDVFQRFYSQIQFKNKGTSNIATEQIVPSLSLNFRYADCRRSLLDVGIFLRVGSIEIDVRTAS